MFHLGYRASDLFTGNEQRGRYDQRRKSRGAGEFYSGTAHDWKATRGTYRIEIGTSSRDIKQTLTFKY